MARSVNECVREDVGGFGSWRVRLMVDGLLTGATSH